MLLKSLLLCLSNIQNKFYFIFLIVYFKNFRFFMQLMPFSCKTVIDLCSGSCSVSLAAACFGYNSCSIDDDINQLNSGYRRLSSYKNSYLDIISKIPTLIPGPSVFKSQNPNPPPNLQKNQQPPLQENIQPLPNLHNEQQPPPNPQNEQQPPLQPNQPAPNPQNDQQPPPNPQNEQQPPPRDQNQPAFPDNMEITDIAPLPLLENSPEQNKMIVQLKQTEPVAPKKKKCHYCEKASAKNVCLATDMPLPFCSALECVVKHFESVDHSTISYVLLNFFLFYPPYQHFLHSVVLRNFLVVDA